MRFAARHRVGFPHRALALALCVSSAATIAQGAERSAGANTPPESAAARESRPGKKRVTKPAGRRAIPVRLIPPTDGPDVATLGVESDGTRRVVSYGLRLLSRVDGSVETASQFFPLTRNVQAAEMPVRLGGGFLFSVTASGRTSVWRSPTWTGMLEPFAELDFELERLVPGFDRVYVQARRTGEWAALDAQTGKGIDLGALPRSPSYGSMVFVDEWFAAVELPVRGTVVSFDAGNQWQRLGLPTLALAQRGSDLVIATAEGRRVLGPDGSVRAAEGSPDAAASGAGGERRTHPEGPLGPEPLRVAVLRGFPESRDVAMVAANGALARVRLTDGRVLEVRHKALSPSSECSAVRHGEAYAFVCGEPQGKTQILEVQAPLSLRVVAEFESPRAIRESGNGALVIRGGCGPKALDAAAPAHCIRTRDGNQWELPPGDVATERVVALRDGRAARIVPPRVRTRGELVVTSSTGKTTARTLQIANRGGPPDRLLRRGFWLDGFVEAADGTLRGWVTGLGLFAGVQIARDGTVRVGPLQRHVERAVLAGERALLIPSAGIAEESTDSGLTWSDADLPVEIEADPTKAPTRGSKLEHGCSALGCSFLGWLRIGWNGAAGSQPLPYAGQPKPTSLPNPGGSRWLLRCAPTGESSPRVSPVLGQRRAAEFEEGETRANWLPLIEQAPPPLPREAIGFDAGTEGQLRGYAWAPRGAEFGKAGRFSVAVADPFQIRGGVWMTRATPSPWPDAIQVAEVFGYEGSSPAVWNVALDASGRSGVLAISARGTTDLYAVEEGRAAQHLVNATRSGVGAITSAVRVGTTYYVSAQEDGRTFRVFALESGKARMVGQYSDASLGRTISPVLVRSTRSDALGIWGRGAGWFIFPVDPSTGIADQPVHITPRQLSRMPSVCAPDEEGYLLEGPVGVDPYADFVGGADEVSARAFEGRFVASSSGICLSQLAARSDGVIRDGLRPQPGATRLSTPSVPLVLSDRASGGRRWGFRCSP